MGKKKGKKIVKVKPLTDATKDKFQIDPRKALENEKKINPAKIFEGYKKNDSKKYSKK